jgi:uncharacterized SAM-binding protein YcdF (DUF218 family)
MFFLMAKNSWRHCCAIERRRHDRPRWRDSAADTFCAERASAAGHECRADRYHWVIPLGNAMLLPIENRFPHWDASRGAPDGVIVLGGVINSDISAARGEISVGDAAERVLVIAELARRYPTARIAFSGGNGELDSRALAEADFVEQLFQSFGISHGRILLERDSRDTAENARYAKRSVNPKPGERWLLVTSAAHMPRAVGAFRMVGFPVAAYPVDWQTRGWEDLWSLPGSLSGGFAAADAAAHEWVGLLIYWLIGRTSELFPGPLSRDLHAYPARNTNLQKRSLI